MTATRVTPLYESRKRKRRSMFRFYPDFAQDLIDNFRKQAETKEFTLLQPAQTSLVESDGEKETPLLHLQSNVEMDAWQVRVEKYEELGDELSKRADESTYAEDKVANFMKAYNCYIKCNNLIYENNRVPPLELKLCTLYVIEQACLNESNNAHRANYLELMQQEIDFVMKNKALFKSAMPENHSQNLEELAGYNEFMKDNRDNVKITKSSEPAPKRSKVMTPVPSSLPQLSFLTAERNNSRSLSDYLAKKFQTDSYSLPKDLTEEIVPKFRKD